MASKAHNEAKQLAQLISRRISETEYARAWAMMPELEALLHRLKSA